MRDDGWHGYIEVRCESQKDCANNGMHGRRYLHVLSHWQKNENSKISVKDGFNSDGDYILGRNDCLSQPLFIINGTKFR